MAGRVGVLDRRELLEDVRQQLGVRVGQSGQRRLGHVEHRLQVGAQELGARLGCSQHSQHEVLERRELHL
ncbi:MAG TPA: hypothetical protein VF056_03805 [Thermoleophilaceae bacterium]